jgi:hypothetical protein
MQINSYFSKSNEKDDFKKNILELKILPISLVPVWTHIATEVKLIQGCGSGLIYYGSGSSIFAQSGSGSTKSLNPDQPSTGN